MSSIRVHELAKEEGLSSSDLIKELDSIGIEVKSHMSSISDDDLAKYKAAKKGKKVPKGKSVEAETGAKPASLESPVKEKKRVTKAKKGVSKTKTPLAEETKTKKISKEKEQNLVSVTEEKVPEKKIEEEVKEEKKAKPRLAVKEGTTVKKFAEIVERPASEIIKTLMSLGEMVTINQPMANEAMKLLGEDYGYEVNITSIEEEAEEVVEGALEDQEPRPPIVTIMGHVDHGKTSLLDSIRKTNVISEEAGGMTQHIGAYQVVHQGKKITFIDTPGHEAFTAMRARGAKVTDLAVLVVAADDGVKPQTIEAVDHARAAHVPILVAINKIDKPEANIDKVRRELGKLDLVPEDWGGDTVFVNISAKYQQNLEELLEMIVLVAELQELKANPKVPASGVAIEARLDKGRGPVATVLIQQGTLKVGDAVVAGLAYGKVRAMLDDKGNNIPAATPGQPVEVLGLSSVPNAGDMLKVVVNERAAKGITEERALHKRVLEMEKRRRITLDDLFLRIKEGEIQELNIILKGDVQGSLEALQEALEKLEHREVRLNIIHSAVGAISESDVMLAAASNAIIIGFNVRPEPKAKVMAIKEKVDLRMYQVIYKVVEDINAAMIGMLKPEFEEIERGRGEVVATFKIKGTGIIAGVMVNEGEMVRGAKVRIVRDGIIVHDGEIMSLRRYKEDVHSVESGLECGMAISNFQDIKAGDVVESYEMREKPRI